MLKGPSSDRGGGLVLGDGKRGDGKNSVYGNGNGNGNGSGNGKGGTDKSKHGKEGRMGLGKMMALTVSMGGSQVCGPSLLPKSCAGV